MLFLLVFLFINSIIFKYKKPKPIKSNNSNKIHQITPIKGSLDEKPIAPASLPQFKKK